MAYVYTHTRIDTNEVFYVGIGSDKHFSRSKDSNNRNKFWKNIVSKTEYVIDIVNKNISKQEAADIEKLLIIQYGRRIDKSGSLCNISSGGEFGSYGVKRSEEYKKNLSSKMKGRKLSKETIDKIKKNSGTKIICTITKKIYNSITEAAESNNINKNMLYGNLYRNLYNDTRFMIYDKYLIELNDIENFLKKVL